ncbi:uncharacterized protein LOC121420211 [Lytechinus variegatus]|uniref:uncharacterized protein LOC121420211 n=1 Tax=Lytechinus variegatus TaxID=7654 RepID=UPI001BB21C42|nr:uncharacterized protein LOC121420211 [Lytechinus variegatus]
MKGIPESKLLEIADDIGNRDVVKIGVSGGLTRPQVESLDSDCYKVLTKIMADTTPREQKSKLRQILTDCNHTAAADTHLPTRKKTAPKTNLPKKRELESPTIPTEDATPAKKKPRAKSKLETEKMKLKQLKADQDVLRKKQKEIDKDIDQNSKELEKTQNVVKKLMEQEIQDDMKKIEKRKKELDKLSLPGISTSQKSTSNTNS